MMRNSAYSRHRSSWISLNSLPRSSSEPLTTITTTSGIIPLGQKVERMYWLNMPQVVFAWLISTFVVRLLKARSNVYAHSTTSGMARIARLRTLTGHQRLEYPLIVYFFVVFIKRQYPELSCASYNKNPAALNEPDGIVAVWNLHLLERPEFVFHSQVRCWGTVVNIQHHLYATVRRIIRGVLTVPFQLDLRGDVFWANITLGYALKASTGVEDAALCCWTHPSCIRDADGRNAECSQPDHE